MYLAGSCPAWPRQRSDTDSIKVGPPPSRARSTALERRCVHLEDVPPVHPGTGHAVRGGPLGDRGRVELDRVRRRVGELVVVHDPDHRQVEHGRGVEGLVPATVGRRPVAADREGHTPIAGALVRPRGSHRDGIGDRKVRDDGERSVAVPVADMAVPVATSKVAVDPTPVLGHDPLEVEALRQLGGEVSVGDEERVRRRQRERRAHMCPLLTSSRIEGAGKTPLSVQRLHPLVEVSGQLQLVEHLLQPVVRERARPRRLLAQFRGH